jgi:hypothetical protein
MIMMIEILQSFNVLIGLQYAIISMIIIMIILLLLLPKSIRLGLLSEFLLEINSFYHNSSSFHKLGRLLGNY